jgi:hypothetical protein
MLQVGKEYTVTHARRGKFDIEVTKTCDVWVTGVITRGAAIAQMSYNTGAHGDTVTVRRSMCTFEEVSE